MTFIQGLTAYFSYLNMDYVFWSAILVVFLPILVCYDIGCQWKWNLTECHILLSDHLASISTDEESADVYGVSDIQVALPIWHGDIHELDCKTKNSIQYQEGAGALDREVMECNWSILNLVAYLTKEMGEGNRLDTLDDKVDYMNFSKNMGLGEFTHLEE